MVRLPMNTKLDIRLVGANVFSSNPDRIFSFQVGAKKYYADPIKSSTAATRYISDDNNSPFALTPVTAALPEVFTTTYRINPQGGCSVTVFKTKLTANGEIDGPKESVWEGKGDCGQTDQFLAQYGEGLKGVLAANGQQADIYLCNCDKPNQYVHVTATNSQTLTGSAPTTRTGTANILVWGCWNSKTEAWQSVKTDFRTAPVVNDNLAAKGVSAGMVNDAFERKANALLRQRSKEVSPGDGTNTNFNAEVGSPQEGKFQYKNANLFAFIAGLKDISGQLIKLAKVPEPMWNPANAEYTKSVVNLPSVLAGGADQTLEELTDGLQFVDLALDIAMEPKKAKEIWDGIKSITPAAVGNIVKEHAAIYQQGGTKAFYQGGRDGITVAFMWKGVASLAVKLATSVKSAGATMVALTTGVTKVADDVLGLLRRLRPKFSSRQFFDAFIADFRNNAELVRQFDAGTLDVKAWEVLQANDRNFVRRSSDYLLKFQKLTPDVQKLIAEFSDIANSSTLAKFLDDLGDADFLKYVNDPANEKYVRGFVNHKLTDIDQQDIGGLLAEVKDAGDINPKVTQWLERSGKADRFKYFRELGNELSDNIKSALRNKNSTLFGSLKSKLSIPNLDSYDLLEEIPLTTIGGNMRADIMFVKRNPITFQIEDVIIIENKLSTGTAFTPRQIEGFSQIGQTGKIRAKFALTGYWTADAEFTNLKQKCFRLSDHGSSDVGRVEIKAVDDTNLR